MTSGPSTITSCGVAAMAAFSAVVVPSGTSRTSTCSRRVARRAARAARSPLPVTITVTGAACSSYHQTARWCSLPFLPVPIRPARRSGADNRRQAMPTRPR